MCFNQRDGISTLKGRPLKLVGKFTYFGSSVLSTENDINLWLAKAWTAIDRLSVTWNSDLTDKIKCFFQAAVVLILLHGCTIWRKSLMSITQECCEPYWTSPGGNTPQNSSCTATYHPSWKLSKLDKPDMQDTTGEIRANSYVMYSCGALHMDEQKLDDLLEPIYNSSLPIWDVAWKTSWEQWTLGMGGEKGSDRSVLAAWWWWWWWWWWWNDCELYLFANY